MANHYEYNFDFLEQWLVAKNLTKDEFQRRMGIKAQSYYRWVEDKHNPMPVQHIINFCNEFGVDINSFFILDGNVENTLPPISKRRAVRGEEVGTVNEQLMQQEISYLKKIDELKTDLHQRERNLMDIILDQEKEIKRLHQIIAQKGPASFESDKPQHSQMEKRVYAAEDRSDDY